MDATQGAREYRPLPHALAGQEEAGVDRSLSADSLVATQLAAGTDHSIPSIFGGGPGDRETASEKGACESRTDGATTAVDVQMRIESQSRALSEAEEALEVDTAADRAVSNTVVWKPTVAVLGTGTLRPLNPPFEGMESETEAHHPTTPSRVTGLPALPNEVLLQILSYLDVSDLLATSRTSHHLRCLSLAPILHRLRLRRARALLPPMLASPTRPTLPDLIARHIFMTHTTVVSRRLARSLVSIRLSRRLAARPSPDVLVARCVLPPECVPGRELVAPGLVAKKRAVERERVKDRLRRWVGSVWMGEVRNREEGVRRWEERVGVGRVWRLRRFWERVGKGEAQALS